VTSLIPMTVQPAAANIFAAIEPTLPKPCTTIVAPLGLTPRRAISSSATIETPRPVASTRPREPPISSGFPVTTPGTFIRWCME
jgi:hypothetical protein